MTEEAQKQFDELPQLVQDAFQLCWEIERLEASEQQTKVSMMASQLLTDIRQGFE